MTGDPFRLLEAEHATALAALEHLERAALGLRSDPDSKEGRAVVREVLALLTTEVRSHNEKEERTLFPMLGLDAPTLVFEEEHRILRSREVELQRLLDWGGAGPALADVALDIVQLLREHIIRENEVLFPVARAVLGPEGIAALARRLNGS
ncbi:MAG: hemerythrin domain-containing protein [Gemmatimonadetes bacterium]|nr:hemerythrin domain-containing protein [Gemmatimonadota bacterium]